MNNRRSAAGVPPEQRAGNFGGVLKSLKQAYSPKKPDIYCQGYNDFVHLFCF
jgi:hypothetical protein